MSTGIIEGNIRGIYCVQLVLSPNLVPSGGTMEQSFPVPGVNLGDVISSVIKPSYTPGLAIANQRITAADTVSITFMNNTLLPITPPAEKYALAFFRLEEPYKAIK